MSLIDPGKKAPAFTLKDQKQCKAHKLSDYAGKPVIRTSTPRTTLARLHSRRPAISKRACPRSQEAKAVVLGVSILDEKSKR